MFCVKEVYFESYSIYYDYAIINNGDNATLVIIDYDTNEELTINANDFKNYKIIGVVEYKSCIVVCKVSKIDWLFMDCIEDIRMDESTRNENVTYMVHKGCEDEPNTFAIATRDKIISQDYMVLKGLHNNPVHFLPRVVLNSVLKTCMDNVDKMYIHHRSLVGVNLVEYTSVIIFNNKLNRFLTKYKTLERKK